MALRQLSPINKPGEFTPHNGFLHNKLNAVFGIAPPKYAYQACDSLLTMVKDEFAPRGIGTELLSDDERKDRAIALFAKGWALTPEDARAKWPTVHPLVQKHFFDLSLISA